MGEISERILELVKEKKLSYKELESMTGISSSALQRYATGETSKIPIDRVELIAGALNTSAAYILGWIDADNENEPPTAGSVRAMLEDLFKVQGILKDGEELTDDMLAAISPAIRAIIQAMRQGKE